MVPQNIWFEDVVVRTGETDFQSRWKLSSIFAAIIEAAAHHAENLGFGYETMQEQSLVWILSRLKIRILQFPRMNDTVTIQTWPKGLQQKVFFLRDYHLLDSNGMKYASATSAFVLVNPSQRRMAPPQALDGTLPENNGLHALDEPLEKIAAGENLKEIFIASARYSSVDLVGHVNNTRYIDWISDCFDFSEHRARQISEMQINYVNEVKPGEDVALLRGTYPGEPGTWYVTGNNLTTGVKAFEAKIR